MAANTPNIIVVGGTYVDMAIRCEQIPSPGQRVSGSALSYSVGGPGPSQAVQAALCGCNVQLISKIGGDPFARFVRDTLCEFGVNSDFLCTAKAKNTGSIVTIVSAICENTSLKYTGANSALQGRDIDSAETIFSKANVCLIHGQLPTEAIIKTIRCAELYGV